MYTVGPQFSGKFIQEKFLIFYSTCLDFYVIAKITSMFNFFFFLICLVTKSADGFEPKPFAKKCCFACNLQSGVTATITLVFGRTIMRSLRRTAISRLVVTRNKLL